MLAMQERQSVMITATKPGSTTTGWLVSALQRGIPPIAAMKRQSVLMASRETRLNFVASVFQLT